MDINTDATNHTAQQQRQNHNGSCYISDANISASEPLCVAALLGFGIKNTLKYVTFQVPAHLKWIPAAPSWLLVPEPTRRSKCQLSYRAHSDIQLVTFFFTENKLPKISCRTGMTVCFGSTLDHKHVTGSNRSMSLFSNQTTASQRSTVSTSTLDSGPVDLWHPVPFGKTIMDRFAKQSNLCIIVSL